MKKRLVYFLCRIGWWKIARLISPKYVAIYKFEKSFGRLKETVEKVSKSFSNLSTTINVINNPKKDGLTADHTYIDESEVEGE